MFIDRYSRFETVSYDRASNRLTKFDDRPGSIWYAQDNIYTYDGLDQLIEADRGTWNGTSLARVGVATLSSQQWDLDMLGNWKKFVRDTSGNGAYTDPTDLIDDRTHNAANEVEESTVRHDGSGPPPVSVPFSYDDAGNIKSARMETTNPLFPSLVSRTYIHDAWNRLVEVVHNNGTTGTTDDFTLSRYRYNGLHWRVWKQANMKDAPAYATPTAEPVQRRAMFYDASWRLIHQEMDDGVDPASGQGMWTPDRAEQLFWGARYIDDAVGRRRSTAIADADDPAPTVTWGALQHYLTDAQFSVVALMDSTAAAGFDIIERVKYDPYGRAVHCQKGDYNGDGVTTVQDIFNHQANYFAGNLAGDANRSGTITVQDIFDYQTLYFAPGKDAAGDQVSSPDVAGGGNDNCVGYCGYIHNPETGDYTVRFRTYMPALGRWGRRDPAGYVEGANKYQYNLDSPLSFIDPFGLCATCDGNPFTGNDLGERSARAAWELTHPKPCPTLPAMNPISPTVDIIDADEYWREWKKANPGYTDDQYTKMRKTLNRGCIGITACNLGESGNPDLSNCYDTLAQAQAKQKAMTDNCDCKGKGPPMVFGKRFWSNQSEPDNARDKPDDTAFLPDPNSGKVDMSKYRYRGRPKYVNFDYAWPTLDCKFIHANHSEPDMKVYTDAWPKVRDFDREVYCAACGSRDFGDPPSSSKPGVKP